MNLSLLDYIFESFRCTRFELIKCEAPIIINKQLNISPLLLHRIAQEAFSRIARYFRPSHWSLLNACAYDPDISNKERLVLNILLQNAHIAATTAFPLCQDTGTATIYAWKAESLYTGADDASILACGAIEAYKKNYLRASQLSFHSFFDEYAPTNNEPVQVHIQACPDYEDPSYKFIFIAKGGGSSHKTAFFSMTKAFLTAENFEQFLIERIKALGTDACPPYRLAVVVGGTSPEFNLEVLKLATTELLDTVPVEGDSWIKRSLYWENRVLEIGRDSGIGAQSGGKYLIADARVLRLARHAASCPVSIGISCCAHRNMLGYIDKTGTYLEQLATKPPPVEFPVQGKLINIDMPMDELCNHLSHCQLKEPLLLSGSLVVARDAAHYRWCQSKEIPDYVRKYPIFYAGPSECPPDTVIGSLGPTTAGRMDSYAEKLLSQGASRITVAKGERSPKWLELCKKYGALYLVTIGGAAALFAQYYVTKSEIIDYPDLGMEAVRLIHVVNIPAFLAVNGLQTNV
ncbi:MAG: fumarate hydratase [Treponema sp.]|jgi:fumarate hydratase class I|nr:fumarate hydratase [Treponema sp.]